MISCHNNDLSVWIPTCDWLLAKKTWQKLRLFWILKSTLKAWFHKKSPLSTKRRFNELNCKGCLLHLNIHMLAWHGLPSKQSISKKINNSESELGYDCGASPQLFRTGLFSYFYLWPYFFHFLLDNNTMLAFQCYNCCIIKRNVKKQKFTSSKKLRGTVRYACSATFLPTKAIAITYFPKIAKY